MNSKDPLGDRMKNNYERVTRQYLPRRTYTIIRIDGKTFSSYLKYAKRPYDLNVMKAMAQTAIALCSNIQGAEFAYTQSDEISILLTDFHNAHSEPWFGGCIQKIVSVSASMATVTFNSHMEEYNIQHRNMGMFDSRVFTIPTQEEVLAYFTWRQKDCIRNSINMLAQHHFPHRELQGVSLHKVQDKLFLDKGIVWEFENPAFRRGQLISQKKAVKEISFRHKKTGLQESKVIERTEWVAEPANIISYEDNYLLSRIPLFSM